MKFRRLQNFLIYDFSLFTVILSRFIIQKLLLFLFNIMIKIILSIFIFFLVLFLYLHILFHLKTSDDLDIYEMDQFTKNKLEEVCDIRQPIIINWEENKKISFLNKDYCIQNFPSFEIKIRNINDTDINTELFIPLQIQNAIKLFHEDNNGIYFSENNGDFLQETGLTKSIKTNDEFMRPYMVSNCYYDLLFGSENSNSPFRYEINYRNYFFITSGSVSIKLAPPRSEKYLSPIYDYENFEFKTNVNPWNVQSEFKDDFDKIKCLDVKLNVGQIIFIPSFWWYSFQFQKDTTIVSLKYRTYMNNIAISPYVALHFLQLQNVKRNNVKKMEVEKVSEKDNVLENDNISEKILEKENIALIYKDG